LATQSRREETKVNTKAARRLYEGLTGEERFRLLLRLASAFARRSAFYLGWLRLVEVQHVLGPRRIA